MAKAYQLAFIPFFVVYAIGGICYCLMQIFFEQDRQAVDEALQSATIKEEEDIEDMRDPEPAK